MKRLKVSEKWACWNTDYVGPEDLPDGYVPWQGPGDETHLRPQKSAGERGTSITEKFSSGCPSSRLAVGVAITELGSPIEME